MKKYIKLLAMALTAFTVTSCNDMINLDNDGHTNMDKLWSDYNGVRGYLNACYNYRIGTYTEPCSTTDEAIDASMNTAGSNYQRWYNTGFVANNYYAYNFEGDWWGNFYQGIRKCNIFLANIDASQTDATDNMKAAWKAQAHTLRAYYYLQLMKRWGQVPLLTSDIGQNADYTKVQKASVGEITKQIIADCEEALATPESEDGFGWYARDNENNIMTRAVCYAIESEAITFAKSPLFEDGTFTWDYAIQITKNALYQLLTHDYSLWTKVSANHMNAYDSYFDHNWNDKRAEDKETIYSTSGQYSWFASNGLPSTDGQTSAGMCPTQELVDAYDMANGQEAITGYSDAQHLHPIINTASGYDPANPYKDRDPRFYATVWYNGAPRHLAAPNGNKLETYVGGREGINLTGNGNRYTVTGYYIHKFVDDRSSKTVNYDGYNRFWRLADLYYNFAECAYQGQGPDNEINIGGNMQMSARDAVNKVRERSGCGDLPSGMDKTTFERRFRKDRLVEFAFEGKRFFDVRRWKVLDSTCKQITAMKITKDGTNLKYERYAYPEHVCTTDKYLLYPFNESEVQKMQDFTKVDWQNPGW